MNIIKDFIKRISWFTVLILIILINSVYLIAGDWSVNVLLYSTVISIIISILAYLQHKFENLSKPKIKNIGVICRDANDFVEWKKNYKLDLIEDKDFLNTTKKFKIDDQIFWRIFTPTECSGLTLYSVIETDLAYKNPDYDKIKYILQYTIISNKNIYLK